MAAPSSIGRGTIVRGNVRGDGDSRSTGRVEGGVAVQGELIIGEAALVKSDVSGRQVVVRGAVTGDSARDESVVLEAAPASSAISRAPQIGIRPGALVRGNVSTGSGEGAAAAQLARRAPRTEAPPKAARVPAAPAARRRRLAASPPRPRAAAPPTAATRAAAPPPLARRCPSAHAGRRRRSCPRSKKGAKGALKRKAAR